jgi:hypothetical protein
LRASCGHFFSIIRIASEPVICIPPCYPKSNNSTYMAVKRFIQAVFVGIAPVYETDARPKNQRSFCPAIESIRTQSSREEKSQRSRPRSRLLPRQWAVRWVACTVYDVRTMSVRPYARRTVRHLCHWAYDVRYGTPPL